MVEIEKLDKQKFAETISFKDTLIYDPLQNEAENYYLLTERKLTNGQYYQVKVLTAYIGWSEYLKTIVGIFAAVLFLLLFVGALINHYGNRKLWQPFLINLARIRSHSIKSENKLVFEPSNIDEFKELNIVLAEADERNREQYIELKEFNENVSHELQTPLSIVRARLESISQLALTDEAAILLKEAKTSLERLRKINKGLLLLTKISNDQIDDPVSLSLSNTLAGQLETFAELFVANGLTLDINIKSTYVQADPNLAEILISNLITNTLVYSDRPGVVNIGLADGYLYFENPGPALPFSEKDIFVRFKKGKKGVGLGLAIVKQICQRYNWQISYSYTDRRHRFDITLN
nr:HAMP domain-containing sensor histidine kinase [Mucilaginibacter sp. JRF]